jgi:nucleoid DNA-binding protein
VRRVFVNDSAYRRAKSLVGRLIDGDLSCENNAQPPRTLLSKNGGESSMSETTAKPMTRTEMIASLASSTGLTKQQVNDFFEELVKLIADQLKAGGPGVVNIAGLMKVKVTRKPAQPERRGPNPFTGEETVFKAKPAQNVVKISPLKRLKDSV